MARSQYGGQTQMSLLEFSQSNEGVIKPKELYELVYQMAFEEEARGRFEQLQQEVSRGLEIREETGEMQTLKYTIYGLC